MDSSNRINNERRLDPTSINIHTKSKDHISSPNTKVDPLKNHIASHNVSSSDLKERTVTENRSSSAELNRGQQKTTHVAQSELSPINQLLKSEEKISKSNLDKIVILLQSGEKISEEDLVKVVKAEAEFTGAKAISDLLSGRNTLPPDIQDQIIEFAIIHQELKLLKILMSQENISDKTLEHALEVFNSGYNASYDPKDVEIIHLLLDKRAIPPSITNLAVEGFLFISRSAFWSGDANKLMDVSARLSELISDESALNLIQDEDNKNEVFYNAAICHELKLLKILTIDQTFIDDFVLDSFEQNRFRTLDHDKRFNLVASVSAIIESGKTLSRDARHKAIELAASHGQLDLLELLLKQGAIPASVRDLAIIEASGGQRDQIYAMLRMARIDNSIEK